MSIIYEELSISRDWIVTASLHETLSRLLYQHMFLVLLEHLNYIPVHGAAAISSYVAPWLRIWNPDLAASLTTRPLCVESQQFRVIATLMGREKTTYDVIATQLASGAR